MVWGLLYNAVWPLFWPAILSLHGCSVIIESRQHNRGWTCFGGLCVRRVNPKHLLMLGTFPQKKIQKGEWKLRHQMGLAYHSLHE